MRERWQAFAGWARKRRRRIIAVVLLILFFYAVGYFSAPKTFPGACLIYG